MVAVVGILNWNVGEPLYLGVNITNYSNLRLLDM